MHVPCQWARWWLVFSTSWALSESHDLLHTPHFSRIVHASNAQCRACCCDIAQCRKSVQVSETDHHIVETPQVHQEPPFTQSISVGSRCEQLTNAPDGEVGGNRIQRINRMRSCRSCNREHLYSSSFRKMRDKVTGPALTQLLEGIL